MPSYNASAIAKLCMGDVSGAIQNLYLLLDSYPEMTDGYILRAKLYRLLNECFSCHIDIVKAKALDPNHPELAGTGFFYINRTSWFILF